jgi:hypothetical protein
MTKILISAAVLLSSFSALALSYDSDVPQAIRNQMAADLKFIGSVVGNGQTPLHAEIYKAVSGKSYQSFFEARISSVGLDDCGGGGAVACVQPFSDPHKMWLSPAFTDFDTPQIDRINTIFHEARHSEGQYGFWKHDNCPIPFLDEKGQAIRGSQSGIRLEGLPACDATPYGSYGSSTIMMKNIVKYCANCSEKIKMDAQMIVDEMMLRMYVPAVKKQMNDDFKN